MSSTEMYEKLQQNPNSMYNFSDFGLSINPGLVLQADVTYTFKMTLDIGEKSVNNVIKLSDVNLENKTVSKTGQLK